VSDRCFDADVSDASRLIRNAVSTPVEAVAGTPVDPLLTGTVS
jgi:hypothetical protein